MQQHQYSELQTGQLVQADAVIGPSVEDARIRPIRPEDKGKLLRFFRGLSRESVALRFLSVLKDLPDKMLANLTELDFARHVAIVATLGKGTAEQFIGVARFIISNDDEAHRDRAEVAVTVADEYQGMGLGRRLLLELVPLAQERGVQTFDLLVSAGNTTVLNMVNRHTGVISKRYEAGSYRILCSLEDIKWDPVHH